MDCRIYDMARTIPPWLPRPHRIRTCRHAAPRLADRLRLRRLDWRQLAHYRRTLCPIHLHRRQRCDHRSIRRRRHRAPSAFRRLRPHLPHLPSSPTRRSSCSLFCLSTPRPRTHHPLSSHRLCGVLPNHYLLTWIYLRPAALFPHRPAAHHYLAVPNYPAPPPIPLTATRCVLPRSRHRQVRAQNNHRCFSSRDLRRHRHHPVRHEQC
ncbi:Hypothetical protein [Corynebacterium glutamicum ATCC 13032]|uniref:Uncharacterized protein n=1 Tax=Corynebacterium glutamicum (strain ATCC 13032 / DSM 20300 / JCM 1318 / BCRC 11384 / CCUG 27702 / LMG 3730 / NBRC 12168 / NCIMB 10025 / NRRL B-2784 / 534) TaxID=196627 RepID=Q8NU20_CORGL|nr:Hypothetical protein [Corynebacterium glutamicum ATCC 13032]